MLLMKKIFNFAFLILLFLPLLACSDSEQFRVNGTIEGKPTMNLRAAYYADGAFHNLITAVREGEFEFYGKASQPALLEITDYEHRPIARLLVVNGETYTVKIDPATQFGIDISGNDANVRWSAFLRKNAEALNDNPNNAVARYIAEHPDDIVSTLLLITTFDASTDALRADSLMAMIAPQARPSNIAEAYNYILQRLVGDSVFGEVLPLKYVNRDDSLCSFNPAKQKYSLIVLSRTDNTFRADSILPALRRMHKNYFGKKLAILDFSLDADAHEWKRATNLDSAGWNQGWAAGSVAAMGIERLGVPRTPFFILCDSSGQQLFRGGRLLDVENKIDSLLKK